MATVSAAASSDGSEEDAGSEEFEVGSDGIFSCPGFSGASGFSPVTVGELETVWNLVT